ncbi:MAG: rod shape-determining protein MreD [Burkholderiales bacterium]|nr:rod shape-determining protein MreD [Burkholderiales bacterium]
MQLAELPAGERILAPVRPATIAASLAAALALAFLPWRDVLLVPDFVALALAFWCVHEPRRVGLATAWALGVVVDVGNGVLLGQHALAYAFLAFGAIELSRRILWFGPWGQALHVAGLLVLAQAVALAVRLAAGADFPGWTILVGPIIGAALWPALGALRLILPRRASEPEAPRAL